MAISAAIRFGCTYFAGARSLSLVVAPLVPGLWIIAFKDFGFWEQNGSCTGFWPVSGILEYIPPQCIILNNKFGRGILR